jgi:L-seryl-tRNA(Ser) seleniumtransferase
MDNRKPSIDFRQIPGIDKILHTQPAEEAIKKYGRPVMTYAVRRTVEKMREDLAAGAKVNTQPDTIVAQAAKTAEAVYGRSLKEVVNATGVVLHTNLGRAPLGESVVNETGRLSKGYCNLEFDLESASRGHRADHISDLLSYLTGSQGVVVVNNNAAGIILTLGTLARGREVIISRGELIEIGGAFRIPEIMEASGAKMIEVGTTNRTRLSDYEKAVNSETALIFKAHKSNYCIKGFTEEASVSELSGLCRSKKLPFVYDIGSGLLRKPSIPGLENEPDVRTALEEGADLVMCSCDKLLGGPQAGIIAGTRELISRLSKAPLMRALRVGKITLASLTCACRNYLSDEDLVNNNPVFHFLERKIEERERLAKLLFGQLAEKGINSEIVKSNGQCGGGTLPDLVLPGFAVSLLPPSNDVRTRETFAETLFKSLLKFDKPVLGVLREGRLLFDTFALYENEIGYIVSAVSEAVRGMKKDD